jgi:hypothetical protein
VSGDVLRLSLVAHYGPKPPAFAGLATKLQDEIGAGLGASFAPYDLEQVHATVVGLELERRGGALLDKNFLELRGEARPVDLNRVLELLRRTPLLPLVVQVGGFQSGAAYPFTSQGEHPHRRSLLFQGDRAVAMGWPVGAGSFPPALDALRRAFQEVGVLHKWHRRPEDVDNDFYFVLGTVLAPAVSSACSEAVAKSVRQLLASLGPLHLTVSLADLSFVGYEDVRLPLSSTRAAAAADPTLDGSALLALASAARE